MTGYPKPFTWKSKKYLDYIRKQPCLICGHKSEAHHIRKASNSGIGMKPSDSFSLPLCRLHHAEAHCQELKHLKPFFERHGLDVYEELFKMTKGYIEANK